MQYELIGEKVYLNFPVEPEKKWLALEEVCRRNFNEIIELSRATSVDSILRMQYMHTISAAAEELGIAGLDVPVVPSNFDNFLMAVTRTATRLRLKSSSGSNALSVAVSRSTRAKIISQIERLRRIVDASDLPEKEKKKLHAKIVDLEAAILSPRADFGRVFSIIAYLAMSIGGTTAFLADAPDALTTISGLIAEEKQAEDEEQRQIEASKQPIAIPDMRHEESNDEAPF